MMGGGTKYDQSSGAERVGNAEFARREKVSRTRSDEVEWGKRMFGVRMTPAHPWYVGRGEDKCGVPRAAHLFLPRALEALG